MKKKKPQSKTIRNKRAAYDYHLEDSLVVGIELNGRETKALRLGHGQLVGSYVNIRNNELYLVNCLISTSNTMQIPENEQTRDRKLLAKRKEIDALIEVKKQGRAILPTEILTQGRFIKVRIAIGKGKKKYDKRQTLKAKDENKRINTEVSRHI
jgi:SsrA-binding protein